LSSQGQWQVERREGKGEGQGGESGVAERSGKVEDIRVLIFIFRVLEVDYLY